MQNTKDHLYDLIKDLKTKQEFEKEIKTKSIEFDNLIDENVVALLIVDELGRNTQTISKISELKSSSESTIVGQIRNIQDTRKFNRKNGTKGKVVNLEIEDDSGFCGLVLWDKDVELVKTKKIKIGTKVKVINGYVKDGFKGLEINIGRWGLLEIEPKDIQLKEKTYDEKKINGKIIEIIPTHAFFKDNGEFGFVTKIKLKAKDEIREITIWDDKVKEIQKFKKGDTIKIINYNIKQISNKTEIHLNGKAVIEKC